MDYGITFHVKERSTGTAVIKKTATSMLMMEQMLLCFHMNTWCWITCDKTKDCRTVWCKSSNIIYSERLLVIICVESIINFGIMISSRLAFSPGCERWHVSSPAAHLHTWIIFNNLPWHLTLPKIPLRRQIQNWLYMPTSCKMMPHCSNTNTPM